MERQYSLDEIKKARSIAKSVSLIQVVYKGIELVSKMEFYEYVDKFYFEPDANGWKDRKTGEKYTDAKFVKLLNEFAKGENHIISFLDKKYNPLMDLRSSTFNEHETTLPMKGFKTATYGRKSHRDNILQLKDSVKNMF